MLKSSYLQSFVVTNVFLGLQTFRHPKSRQRQPAMLTVRHRYMYVVTEAFYLKNIQMVTGRKLIKSGNSS